MAISTYIGAILAHKHFTRLESVLHVAKCVLNGMKFFKQFTKGSKEFVIVSSLWEHLAKMAV